MFRNQWSGHFPYCFQFAYAEVIENDVTLKFNADGKFKILHICDIQDTNYCAPQTLDYIARPCDAEESDLVVLGGDENRGIRVIELGEKDTSTLIKTAKGEQK